MAKRSSPKPAPSILANSRRFDLTSPDTFEQGYPAGDFRNNIEKIYDLPGTEDMAGVFLRGVIKNERQRNAMVRLFYRHKKFNDQNHQEMLRVMIAATAGMNGLARIEALEAGTNLLALDVHRLAAGLPQLKKGETDHVVRGSDFRQESRPQNGLAQT